MRVALVVVLALGAAVVPLAPAAAATECTSDHVAYVHDAPQALTTLAAREAWRSATGAGVVVAVVDSGVEPGNAHLSDAVVAGTDLTGASVEQTGRTDTSAHGTAIAGVIAARPLSDVDSGLVGLAPDATILPVRVLTGDDDEARRAGTGPDVHRVAEGIRWAAQHGARVVNVSVSFTADDPDLHAAVREATAAGALVVASAGNRLTAQDTSDGPRYPAAYPEALAVTAVDEQGAATDDAIHGPHVDVAAPGRNVLSSYLASGDCVFAGDGSSSSYATAYVSAAAALLAERHPDESPAQWAYRLEVTAARVHAGERDDLLGWGVVRPDQALTVVDDGSAAGPDSPVHARPAAVERPVRVVAGGVAQEPLAQAQGRAVWWVLAGLTAATLTVLLGRVVGVRRRRGR